MLESYWRAHFKENKMGFPTVIYFNFKINVLHVGLKLTELMESSELRRLWFKLGLKIEFQYCNCFQELI